MKLFSMAFWEICFLLPRYMAKTYNMSHTKWAIVCKTDTRLFDTVYPEIKRLFPNNTWDEQEGLMGIHFPGIFVELYFRSLDKDNSMDRLRSLRLTGALMDDLTEVTSGARELIITRLGRWPTACPVRYLIETENDGKTVHHTLGSENFVIPE